MSLACAHDVLAPPDSDGKSICVDCGTIVSPTLTRSDFDLAVAQMAAAPHTVDCVSVAGEWFCARDCGTRL